MRVQKNNSTLFTLFLFLLYILVPECKLNNCLISPFFSKITLFLTFFKAIIFSQKYCLLFYQTIALFVYILRQLTTYFLNIGHSYFTFLLKWKMSMKPKIKEAQIKLIL